MSNITNDTIKEYLNEFVEEYLDDAVVLQRKVFQKIKDNDLEGAIDSISKSVHLNDISWEMKHRDIKGNAPSTEFEIDKPEGFKEEDKEGDFYAEQAETDKLKEWERSRGVKTTRL